MPHRHGCSKARGIKFSTTQPWKLLGSGVSDREPSLLLRFQFNSRRKVSFTIPAGRWFMHSSSEILKNAVAAAKETLQSLLDLGSQVAKAADLIEQCLRAGNKLLVCGNGGSAADASHFATEFVVRFMKDRPAYPAICLAGDGGLLSAAGN